MSRNLAVALVIFFAWSSGAHAQELNQHEWPQYRGNAGFTGRSPDESVKPPLKLEWSYRLDGDASGDAGAGVIVAGGKVFVPVHNTRSLVTLDAHTGRFLWENRDPANSYRSVPTYHDGRVFIWQRGKAKEFTILALDANTGKEQWRHAMAGEHSDYKRVGLPVAGDKLYCSEGGDSPSLFALNVKTGQVAWRTPLGGELGKRAITPAVADGKVFVATCDSVGYKLGTTGAVIACDAATGKELWRRAGLFPNRTLISDGRIVVCTMFSKDDSNGYVLDAKTGATIWSSPAQFHYNPSTITDDLVLIRPYGASCFGLDRESGDKVWSFSSPKVTSGCCAPAVSGQFAYFGTGVISPGDLESPSAFRHVHAPREQGITGTMHALDLKTGKSVWHFSTANTICGDPAIAYGRLYFTSRDGNVYCFVPAALGEPTTPDTKDRTPGLSRQEVLKLLEEPAERADPGKNWIMQGATPQRAGAAVTLPANLELAWTANAGDRIVASAAVRDGRVVTGSDAGKLLAFDLKSGAKLWEHAVGGRVRCTPAVAADAVYCGADDGMFRALDPATGKKLWQYEVGGPIQASPAIVKGLVLFAANDHHVYALDRATGKKAWSARLNDYAIQASPVVIGDLVVVGQWTDWVWGLDLATGEVKWKSFIPITIEAVSAYRERIYVRNPNYVVELDSQTGKRLRLTPASWGWGGLAFINNQMFLSGIQSQYGTNGATVTDLDGPGVSFRTPIPTLEDALLAKSNRLKGGPDLASMAAPLALGDKLCFAPVSGNLTITALDGARLWSHALGGTCHASPIAADGHLIVGCDDGKLYAFRAESE